MGRSATGNCKTCATKYATLFLKGSRVVHNKPNLRAAEFFFVNFSTTGRSVKVVTRLFQKVDIWSALTTSCCSVLFATLLLRGRTLLINSRFFKTTKVMLQGFFWVVPPADCRWEHDATSSRHHRTYCFVPTYQPCYKDAYRKRCESEEWACCMMVLLSPSPTSSSSSSEGGGGGGSKKRRLEEESTLAQAKTKERTEMIIW